MAVKVLLIRDAFQMEGEIDNELAAVVVQRRAIFEQACIQLRQMHPSLPVQLRDFQVTQKYAKQGRGNWAK